MSKYERYNIDLKDLDNESAIYNYTLNDDYFSKIDSPEVSKGEVIVTVRVQKKSQTFELDFNLEGTIQIPCDRCLHDMSQAISHKEKLLVKFGSKFEDENEVVIIPETEGKINIAWFLYEFIVINIPLKHVHPSGECNKSMISKLSKHITKSKSDDDDDELSDNDQDIEFEADDNQIDPRWEGLQNLLDNN